MSKKEAKEQIKDIIKFLSTAFTKLVEEIKEFEVARDGLLPFGFKPHTRSISWIAEQVVLQQAKIKAKKLGFKDIIFSKQDTDVFDCIIIDNSSRKIFVNVKVTNIEGRHNKNDISAAEKLYNFLVNSDELGLFYVVLGIKFENTKVKFIKDQIFTFNPICLPDIYVNPKNAKLQAYYDAEPVKRTKKEFLELLYKASQKKKIKYSKRH
jgi:hypothetical protein